MAPARPASGARTQAAASARRNDPIGDLIGSSSAPASTASVTGAARVIAVQRALSEYGYGQLRLSGTLDEPTVAAIQKFEAERKLPVTGRLSDRLLGELAAMTGRPIQ
jgi:peptidoglycan hydrolase-like protein with peptidoglycan-binding domain